MNRYAGAESSWPIRRWVTLVAVVEAILLLAALAGGGISIANLNSARSLLLDQTGPQLLQANALAQSLLNQETGIRGYLLTGQRDFLQPYIDGRQAQTDAVEALRQLGATPGTEAGNDLEAVLRSAKAWQDVAAAPDQAGTGGPSPVLADRGKTLFDQVRAGLSTLNAHLSVARDTGRTALDRASGVLTASLAVIAALVVILFVLLFLGLRRTITRPITRLAEEVRVVSDDDLHHPVLGTGPRELVKLGADVEAMRRRIVDEVSALERAHALLDLRTQALERSNSDLEQFAYVASHDLQEPLRKVTSFCQLLERRYKGQLDERGEQYIDFAVDGAKRMQSLINDLLAFSRVGRHTAEPVVLDSGRLLDQALANLGTAIEETGARVERGELPEVRGEASLLTAVLQNLVNNALKFHADEPPVVRVEAERDGGQWLFSVTDNGIGIEEQYADRIFVIFQRLHSRTAYGGTGIGLAMCRKIIEHHGGRIWLDTAHPGGSRFRFTLPVVSTVDAGPESRNEDA
ncbi:sensor histidine kinase [Amycolatopsis saalfeldensis]|uniref:histidine kinase n=1 Tax=Amycolatopsis saalfeldensis TaxID=394193 RepID=A0A1H8UDG0_9PSEU|nr:ATP-binding protein [Amycolatopsis saalfeldensis]SEP00678.1 HAMP domain-containing protein [Amycolatopsis saalfeldensis]